MNNEATQYQYLKIINIIADLYKEETDIKDRTVSFLHKLKNLIYFDKAVIVFFYVNKNGQYEIHSTISVDWEQDYYVFDDGTLPLFDQSESIVFKATDFYNPEVMKTSRYWQKYLIPNNCVYTLEGNLDINGENSENKLKAGFSLYRGEDKHDFTDAELEMMELLQPHLSNSLKKYEDTSSAMTILAMLKNYRSVGIAIVNDKYEIITSGEVFRDLAFEKYKDLEIVNEVKKLCDKIKKNDFDMIEYKFIEAPLHLEISKVPPGAYPQNRGDAYSCLLYDLSYFSNFTLDEAKKNYSLTDREFDVLRSLLKGKSNEEIAEELYVSLPTVKKYLASIYGKMNIKNQKQVYDRLKLF